LYINLRKTLTQIEKALPQEGVQDLSKLQKAYEVTLHLRSQIIGVIYDMKQYRGSTTNDSPKEEMGSNKQMVTLIIPEPLPGMKELTAAVEEHWVTMIHDAIEKESMRTDLPAFNIGDTVKVWVKVVEGSRERLQGYEGIVIAKRNGGLRETFTVRRVSYGIGVERVFPMHSPKIDHIDIVRRGDVRRAKLYYLRERSGKSAKVKDKV